MKHCNKCGETKPFELFNKSRRNESGLQSWCRACQAANCKVYYEANRDKELARMKGWHIANRERKLAAQKAWKAANREKHLANNKAWREANRERNLATLKAYREANPDKKNALNAKRRAQKLQATPRWLTPEDYKAIQQFYRKAKELAEETGEPHHVDHIVPLLGKEVCGLHVPHNLQVIPARENIRKNNRYSEELIYGG